VINVSDERPDLENFVAAYNLQQLPILFDPTRKVGPQLKIGFVPQYILFDCNAGLYLDQTAGQQAGANFVAS
jgi:hypothetical protein